MSSSKNKNLSDSGRSAIAAMYEDIIRASTPSRAPCRPHSVCSSPVRFADDSSSDSSPSHIKMAHHSSRTGHKEQSPPCSSPDGDKPGRRGSGALEPLETMDSLARKSLLAAQMFRLVPTEQARARSYLHGRVASTSLLGQQELDRVIPGRTISVFVGTWNMNGQAPPASPIELNELLLPDEMEHVPDMVVVGTQESHSDRFEWEVKIQETIGPTHVMLHSTYLGTLHLAVFIRRDLIWFCSIAEDASESVRPGTAFRTKGAVAICFLLFGTSFLFLTAHLTAHQDKVKDRMNDVKKIKRNLELPQTLPSRSRLPSKDVTTNFDYVFWFGDLNFRLEQTREDVLQWASKQSPVQVDLQSDQLKKLMTEGTCLSSFREGEIMFPPTYKYDPGTQDFDTSSKQRTPAYTDRILYKSNQAAVECTSYDSVPSICTSDHKPVWGVYNVPIRPGKDTVPLAAGLFNRDVYLEGINRRIAEMQRQEQGRSAACSIQ